MPSFLVYWKTYWEDDPTERAAEVRRHNPDWHSQRETFVRAVCEGGDIWVVANGGAGDESRWLLLEHFLVPPQPLSKVKRGDGDIFRISGEVGSYDLFALSQDDFAPVLRQLEFSTGKHISQQGKMIGQALQSPRELSPRDVVLLEEVAKSLPRR